MESESSDLWGEDEYHHVHSDLIYSPTSVPGRGIDLTELESQLMGCECSDHETCLISSSCQSVHICEQNYSSKVLLEVKWGNSAVVECNSQCTCSVLECSNRLVQFGPRKGLEVFFSSMDKGFGLRTKTLIPKGTFICEYAGELIGKEEAKNRFKIASTSGKMNYIFILREMINLPMKTSTIETIVDPSIIGNIGRYVNHSCDPNAGIVPVRVDSPIPKLAIFAKRIILPDEEISYDYSGGCKALSLENEIAFKKKPCLCGSTICQGYLPFDASLT